MRYIPCLVVAALTVSACTADNVYPQEGVIPTLGLPVTTNDTPYSQCLAALAKLPGRNMPVFAVGEIGDKTGQIDRSNNSTVLTQGITEMMISAFFKTGRVSLVERFDLRIPLAEAKMVQQKLAVKPAQTAKPIRASNFVVMGALTELNFNIVSEGARIAAARGHGRCGARQSAPGGRLLACRMGVRPGRSLFHAGRRYLTGRRPASPARHNRQARRRRAVPPVVRSCASSVVPHRQAGIGRGLHGHVAWFLMFAAMFAGGHSIRPPSSFPACPHDRAARC